MSAELFWSTTWILSERICHLSRTSRKGGGRERKKRSRYENVSVLNHVTCFKSCKDVLRNPFWALITTSGMLVWLYPGETQWHTLKVEGRQSPGHSQGWKGTTLQLPWDKLPLHCCHFLQGANPKWLWWLKSSFLPNQKFWNHSDFQASFICIWVLCLFLSIYITKDMPFSEKMS